MSASEHLSPAQFYYHGTSAELSPGGMVETGHPTTTSRAQNRVLQNSGGNKGLYNHATRDLMVATAYAQRAQTVRKVRHHEDVPARVYQVEFTGESEIDPDAGARKGVPLGYRSQHPLRVIGEVEPKYDHG